jgi:hypothetical protein
MAEAVATGIAVGDQVRVHFHPPYPMQSFCEGTVSRVDVSAPQGRFFVVDVTHEIILDREHPVRRGFQDFVRYECPNDFPSRIEILSTAAQDVERSTTVDLLSEEPPEEPQHDVAEQQATEVNVQSEPEPEQIPEAEANSEPAPFDVESQPVRKQGGLLAALFGRGR